MAITRITLRFSEPMSLPTSAGFTITDDGGGSYTISEINLTNGDKDIELHGTWTPDDAEEQSDNVTVAYNAAVGDLQGAGGSDIPSFAVLANYLQVYVPSALSSQMFYSFDMQRSLQAPLNMTTPQQNVERFFFANV